MLVTEEIIPKLKRNWMRLLVALYLFGSHPLHSLELFHYARVKNSGHTRGLLSFFHSLGLVRKVTRNRKLYVSITPLGKKRVEDLLRRLAKKGLLKETACEDFVEFTTSGIGKEKLFGKPQTFSPVFDLTKSE
mgnify:CR=1 FL=1